MRTSSSSFWSQGSFVARPPSHGRSPAQLYGSTAALLIAVEAFAVRAPDDDAGDVADRLLLEVELLPLAHAALAVHVGERDPREVRQVSALARGHEPHRHRARPLVLGALVAVAAVLVLELLCRARQPAALLAHEPAGKLKRADADVRARVAPSPSGAMRK